MKKFAKFLFSFVLSLVLMSPVAALAADAYIVYDDPNGFISQQESMKNKYSTPDAYVYKVRSSQDFIDAWNIIASESHTVDNLIIMLHGGKDSNLTKGELYFYQESGWSDFSKLNYMGTNLDGNIMLLSCHGGSLDSNSVAYNLAKRGACSVVAAQNSSVDYGYFSKDPELHNTTASSNWVKISAIKGTTYKCTVLGKSWSFSYLN